MRRNYDDPVYKRFRLEVLKRDNFKCQMCNTKSKSGLHVHHIKQWSKASSLRYDISNGITLCIYCHKAITGKENHYEKLFKEIIDGKEI